MILKQQQLTEWKTPYQKLFAQLQELAEPYYGIRYQWDGHGNPGFDCSEWVKYVYEELHGVDLPGFTDSLASTKQLVDVILDYQIGDIVLYKYEDDDQPGVVFPHTGIWINHDYVLDSRYPNGVGFNRHLKTPRKVRRLNV